MQEEEKEREPGQACLTVQAASGLGVSWAPPERRCWTRRQPLDLGVARLALNSCGSSGRGRVRYWRHFAASDLFPGIFGVPIPNLAPVLPYPI